MLFTKVKALTWWQIFSSGSWMSFVAAFSLLHDEYPCWFNSFCRGTWSSSLCATMFRCPRRGGAHEAPETPLIGSSERPASPRPISTPCEFSLLFYLDSFFMCVLIFGLYGSCIINIKDINCNQMEDFLIPEKEGSAVKLRVKIGRCGPSWRRVQGGGRVVEQDSVCRVRAGTPHTRARDHR